MGTDPGLPATAIFNFNRYLKIIHVSADAINFFENPEK